MRGRFNLGSDRAVTWGPINQARWLYVELAWWLIAMV